MHAWKLSGALALGIGAVAALALGGPRAGAAEEIAWQSDYTAAQALARESGKPLFVAFR